jgi:hypothetical protein
MNGIKQPLWDPTENQLAQTSHFAIASTVVLAACRLGLPPWAGFLLTLAWAVPKEFGFDLVVEQDSFVDSLEDFVWYALGAVVAVAFCRLTGA